MQNVASSMYLTELLKGWIAQLASAFFSPSLRLRLRWLTVKPDVLLIKLAY